MAGDGVQTVLSLKQLTTTIGSLFANPSLILVALNYTWLLLLAISPLLIFLRGWKRAGLVVVFMLAQAFLLVVVHTATLQLIVITGLVLFLPAEFWSLIQRLIRRPAKISTEKINFSMNLQNIVAILTLTVITLSLLSNLAGTGNLLPGSNLAEQLGIKQDWDMFAPNPISEVVWFDAPGLLANGSMVDAYTQSKLRNRKESPDFKTIYPHARWRKYLVRLARAEDRTKAYFAEYMCRQWDEEHDVKMLNVRLAEIGYDVRTEDQFLKPVIRYNCQASKRR
jgi:hypothetical protein